MPPVSRSVYSSAKAGRMIHSSDSAIIMPRNDAAATTRGVIPQATIPTVAAMR